MSITRKTRITVLLSIIWAIIIFLVALSAGTQRTSWGKRLPFAWEEFLTVFTVGALLPLLIVWGIIWIRSAKEQTTKKEMVPQAVKKPSEDVQKIIDYVIGKGKMPTDAWLHETGMDESEIAEFYDYMKSRKSKRVGNVTETIAREDK